MALAAGLRQGVGPSPEQRRLRGRGPSVVRVLPVGMGIYPRRKAFTSNANFFQVAWAPSSVVVGLGHVVQGSCPLDSSCSPSAPSPAGCSAGRSLEWARSARGLPLGPPPHEFLSRDATIIHGARR